MTNFNDDDDDLDIPQTEEKEDLFVNEYVVGE